MSDGNDLLAQAKRCLPLSALMVQLGFGDSAKKSARCPFHEDSSASFSLYLGSDGEERWKCFTGCGQGDAIDFLAKHRALNNADACREYIHLAGVTPLRSQPSTQKPQPPFDWPSCVAALTPAHRAKLAVWRGYSPEFVEWLHAQNLVGLHDGERIAFPVHDASGQCISCHYRVAREEPDKVDWYFFPTGLGTRPLVIGDPKTAGNVLTFESQWDAFAVMDKLGWHTPDGVPDTAIIITRGAANGKLVAGLCAPSASAYALPQNDPPNLKSGKIPSEEWFKDVCASAGCTVLRVVTPVPHDDPNAWTKSGATADDLWQAIRTAKPFSAATPENCVSNAPIPEPDDTAEPPPKPFPLDSLPPIAAGIVNEVARVERNPPILAACAVLATLSAAIGSGLEVISGPNRQARGNLYILGTAPSGAGKSRAFDLICKPFLDTQREQMIHWQKVVAADLKAEITVLGQRVEQLKAQARKAESDEERIQLREQLKYPLALLDELTKKLHLPRWSTEDVTIEALADLLDQNHEVIFSMSADGRKVADNLLGRMNPNKRVDDSLYLKGFTGDGCTVDRKDKPPTILNRPCIGIFWLIQPDILADLVVERSLMLGGFLPRALICHTRTQRQKIEGAIAPISETALADWHRLITELLTTYHQPGVHHVIQCSEAALQRLNMHFNQTVDQGNGELADVESFVARWTEQAWHLAVVLHAGLWGKDAHSTGEFVNIAATVNGNLDISNYLNEVLKDWRDTQSKFPINILPTQHWPIPFFGNPASALVATVGVNPSSTEFDESRGWDGVRSSAAWKKRLKDYFKSPAHEWFDPWRVGLALLDCSYEAGTAAHFDASYHPTKAMLSNPGTDRAEFRRMVELDAAWFFKLLLLCPKLRVLLTMGPIVGVARRPESLFSFVCEFAPRRGFKVIHNRGFWELWHEATGKVLVIHEADTPEEKCITCRVVKNLHTYRDELRSRIAGNG